MAFKVLIVGGSITGLSLAVMLERYEVDYELFEKHDGVAPQIGASIGLLSHGCRILEQLGCYEELIPHGNGAGDVSIYGPGGQLLGTQSRLGPHLEAMNGYRLFFVERQRVLRALWGAIKDKSKLHTSCGITKIEHFDGGVHVETVNGRIHTGSILVGADGIRSKTRKELWRLAEDDGFDTVADRQAIRSTDSCMFGMSCGLTQVKQTDTWKHVRQGRHYLCAGAPNGLTFWFVFFQTSKQADSWDSLRYTEQEKEDLAREFAGDQVRPDLSFGEMYQASTSAVVVPIEEFVLQRWHHKRIMLLGDSVHKIHPLTGHGGNGALEDSAYLANLLKEMLETTKTPSDWQLKRAFQLLQERRRPRMEDLTEGARRLADLESFASTFQRLIMLHVFPKIPCENILASIGDSMSQGDALKYLPLPARSKAILPYDDEIIMNTTARSKEASYLWIGLFLLIGSLRFIVPFIPHDSTTFGADSSRLPSSQDWRTGSCLAINAVWLIESYRSAFSFGLLLSPLPWIMLAQFISWESTLPIYFSFWIHGSTRRGFYHPWPRAILPGAAQALPVAFVAAVAAASLLPTLLASYPILSKINSLTLAHLILPLLTSVFEDIIVRFRGRRWEPIYQFGNFDMKYLSRFFTAAFLTAGASHIYFISQYLPQSLSHTPLTALVYTTQTLDFIILNLLTSTGLLFTLWDLRRVNATTLSYTKASLSIILFLILAGPGGTLIAGWWLREYTWEKARHRVSDIRYEPVENKGANVDPLP